MKNFFKPVVWLVFLVLNLSPFISKGQTNSDKFKKIQRSLDKAVENGLAGISVYISHPKHGEWVGTSGFADFENGTPLLPEHIISVASVGKTYAATAAVLMQEEGLIDLDALITEYLPEETTCGIPYADEVTVRQLMNMTSGFYNYSRHPELNELYVNGAIKLDTVSHQEALERYVFTMPAWAKPNERYSYSSTNYMLLAMIMDKQLGYPHQKYYEEKIFKPLNLKNTYYRNTPPKNLAQHYGDLYERDTLSNLTDQMIETTNWFMGDDGVYSTAREVGQFMKALCKGEIVSENSWKEMTDWVMPDRKDYGLGLMHDKEILYREIIGHSGAAIGSTADVYYISHRDILVAIVSNTGKRNGSERFKKAYNKTRFSIVKKLLLF